MKSPNERPGAMLNHAGRKTECAPNLTRPPLPFKHGRRRGLMRAGDILPEVLEALIRRSERRVNHE